MTDQSKPLWEVMSTAWWHKVNIATSYSPPERDQWADVIEALTEWLVPETDAIPISEIAEAQQLMKQRLRSRLLEQARIAREGE